LTFFYFPVRLSSGFPTGCTLLFSTFYLLLLPAFQIFPQNLFLIQLSSFTSPCGFRTEVLLPFTFPLILLVPLSRVPLFFFRRSLISRRSVARTWRLRKYVVPSLASSCLPRTSLLLCLSFLGDSTSVKFFAFWDPSVFSVWRALRLSEPRPWAVSLFDFLSWLFSRCFQPFLRSVPTYDSMSLL